MPLFYQHTINQDTKLGVWKIEEDEAFFLRKVPVHRDISHPHKRLQHLAGRYLLQQLFPDFPYALIQIADTRKPFLPDEAFHFSISHAADYAAAIVSRTQRVGVDIEEMRPLVAKITNKFLSVAEQRALQVEVPVLASDNFLEWETDVLQRLTICWSAKEAMFKWFGNGALDFKKNMQILSIRTDEGPGEEGSVACRFLLGEPLSLALPYRVWQQLVLAWVVT